MMNLLNCAHPLTQEQRDAIAIAVGAPLTMVIELQVQFDTDRPFAEQVIALLDHSGLTSEQLQAEPWLILPPSLNFITAILLAELHGRMGHFPAIVRMRPTTNTTITTYTLAEIIDLDRVRQTARQQR